MQCLFHLLFVLHDYVSVVITISFNFIFEADLLCDGIYYKFLKGQDRNLHVLRSITLLITVTTLINALLTLTL